MNVDEFKENKKYAVVKFIADNSYSEIPTAWLLANGNKQLCWWPPRTANAAMLIASCASPNFDLWNIYEVHVVKYCGKYSCINISFYYIIILL